MATKDFKDNPALEFISSSSQEEKPEEKPGVRYKRNPLYIEVRSKRLQLVVQPSLYEKIKARAEEEGVSLNEYCHRALEEAVREEGEE